jgi:hypothetical protein
MWRYLESRRESGIRPPVWTQAPPDTSVICRPYCAAVCAPLSAGEGDGNGIEADDTIKVPEIGRSDAPPGSYGSRRDKPIVRRDALPGCGELGPDTGVRTSGEQAEGQRGKRDQDRLDEGLTAGPVLRCGSVHAVEQLRGRDGGDPDLFVGSQLLFQAPAHLCHGASWRQAPDGALKVDENGGV